MGLLSDAGCPGIADPGALLVEAAHAQGIAVVPLVGPSSVVLALMASGMNGQGFAFHGYVPVKTEARTKAIRDLEDASRRDGAAQIFIETPYRNAALLTTLVETCEPSTRLCIAADLTLPTESVISQSIREWRGVDGARYAKRPAIFILQA
jgi:16S rRNA (cytidine1402-2'-O)-methyltransferase